MKHKKWLIYSLLVLVLIFLVGAWAVRYMAYGVIIPFGSTSCGANFDDGFKKAVAENNPAFCLSADLENVNQYRNIEGYMYCSIPRVGLMKADGGMPRGSVDYCLSNMAEATQNVEACDLMKGPKDSCYLVLAKSTKNFSYCSKISDTSTKNVCLSMNDQGFEGVVESVNVKSSPPSAVISVGQTTYIVDITARTKIIDSNWNYTQLANLKIGGTVTVSGTFSTDGKTVEASNIKEVNN
jgi:hypothetical protein